MSNKTRRTIINDLIKKSYELKKLCDKLAYEIFEGHENGEFDLNLHQQYEELSRQHRLITERIAYLSA